MSKANKTSVFSGVHTIVFVNNANRLVGFYTNLSCVGLKEENHQQAIYTMNTDVVEIQNNYQSYRFLSLLDKAYYHIYPMFLYLIADQPAKRSLSGMLAGNSLLHPCFGYSMNVRMLRKPFDACTTCTNQLYRNQIPILCSKCHCWNLPNTNNNGNQYEYKKPIYTKLI